MKEKGKKGIGKYNHRLQGISEKVPAGLIQKLLARELLHLTGMAWPKTPEALIDIWEVKEGKQSCGCGSRDPQSTTQPTARHLSLALYGRHICVFWKLYLNHI